MSNSFSVSVLRLIERVWMLLARLHMVRMVSAAASKCLSSLAAIVKTESVCVKARVSATSSPGRKNTTASRKWPSYLEISVDGSSSLYMFLGLLERVWSIAM